MRALPLRFALLLATPAAGCGEVERLADLVLLLREPAGPPRRPDHFVEVEYRLTSDAPGSKPHRFTFEDGVPAGDLTSGKQLLTDVEETMTLEVRFQTSSAEDAPAVALGRADPIVFPAVSDLAEDEQVEREAFVFIAAPGAPEALVEDIPGAVPAGQQALCDNAGGHVRHVGGENEYRFDLERLTLSSNQTFVTAGQEVACDVGEGDDLRDPGVNVVAAGECDRDDGASANHAVFVAVGDGGERAVQDISPDDVLPGELCDGFVRVVRDGAWVGGADFVELVDVDNAALLDRIDLTDALLLPPVRFAVLDDDNLLAQGVDEGGAVRTLHVSRVGDLLASAIAEGFPAFVAADPSGPTVLLGNGDAHKPVAAGGAVELGDKRVTNLEGAASVARIVVFGGDDPDVDDRIVALHDDGTIQVEGTPGRVPTSGRTTLARTFGDAVLLAGGVNGHDVFIVP